MEELKSKSSLDQQTPSNPEKKFDSVQEKPEIVDHSNSLLWKLAVGFKDYAWNGYLKPTLLDAGATTLKNVIDILFFGNPTSQAKTNGYPNSSYQVYYKPQGQIQTGIEKPAAPIPGTFDYNSVDFFTYGKAKYALDQLVLATQEYPYAKVGDLYDLAGYPVSQIDYSYGWPDVRNARIIQTPYGMETIKGGKYRIIFPVAPQYTK